MKLPNGYGSVHKLSGAKRRKPWRARITDGYEYDPIKDKQIHFNIFLQGKKHSLQLKYFYYFIY